MRSYDLKRWVYMALALIAVVAWAVFVGTQVADHVSQVTPAELDAD